MPKGHPRKDITAEMLHRWYWDEKKSLNKIGQILGCCGATVRDLMQYRNIPTRTGKEAARLVAEKRLKETGHGTHWRGGRQQHEAGYIQIWKPGYHRANKTGYVYEHILVWEESHKRKVAKGWVVHHLNGIKDDNRLENLMVMPRGRHLHQAEPYKLRIRHLERRIRDLEQALQAGQMLFAIGSETTIG